MLEVSETIGGVAERGAGCVCPWAEDGGREEDPNAHSGLAH